MKPTVILRHRKENLKKCSLRGLETREDISFYTYPKDYLPEMEGAILLKLGAPILSKADNPCTLFLIDGTWRYSELMYSQLPPSQTFRERSLPPGLVTAYPRKQEDCVNKERGLASVEALFAAYYILGRDTQGLLDEYYWKNAFLEKNLSYLSEFVQ